jgi:hypothetical protein
MCKSQKYYFRNGHKILDVVDRQQLLLDYVTSSKLKTFVEVTIATSVRQGLQNLLLVRRTNKRKIN